MRYKLRTLLILLAVLPPLLWLGWGKYQAWKAEQVRQRAAAAALQQILTDQQQAQRVLASRQARLAALMAQLAADQTAKVAAYEAARQKQVDDRLRTDDATRVERLQRQGYLPFPATPRIQPQPKAPAQAGESIDVEHGKGP